MWVLAKLSLTRLAFMVGSFAKLSILYKKNYDFQMLIIFDSNEGILLYTI